MVDVSVVVLHGTGIWSSELDKILGLRRRLVRDADRKEELVWGFHCRCPEHLPTAGRCDGGDEEWKDFGVQAEGLEWGWPR